MFIDIHIHEKTFSDDSFIGLDKIVKRAKEIGLDGICITDHDSNGLYEYAEKFSKENDFLIIVGAEILTYEGDVLVFGLKDLPKEKVHAQELIDMVNKEGGVAISAHPYRENNRGIGDKIRELKGLAGVECFNGSTKPYNNLYAYGIAVEQGLAYVGASDSHWIEAVGKFATYFPNEIKNEKDFIKAIKEKVVKPAMYDGNEFKIIDLYDKLNDRYDEFLRDKR